MYRSYTELESLDTFEERYRYLQLRGEVGRYTFGSDRYINQRFYTSAQWKHIRNVVIARDLACDLGVSGFEIHERLYIHHMNPMSSEDLRSGSLDVLNPEYLITTTHRTHNAIHYGDESLLAGPLKERRPGDTKLW